MDNILASSKKITQITSSEAIELAKNELKKRNPKYPVDEAKITSDDENNGWKEFVSKNPAILNDSQIKNLNLDKKNYWAIYFAPKDEKTLGGDAWIFIDRDNGKIIGVILGQ